MQLANNYIMLVHCFLFLLLLLASCDDLFPKQPATLSLQLRSWNADAVYLHAELAPATTSTLLPALGAPMPQRYNAWHEVSPQSADSWHWEWLNAGLTHATPERRIPDTLALLIEIFTKGTKMTAVDRVAHRALNIYV